jgi:uncharacterized protein (DUF2236 family)
LSDLAWRVMRLPLGRALSLATVGLLPARLRERLGLPWSWTQDLELRALGAAARSATPVMPEWLRNVGPGYVRSRSQEIARGELGG